VFLAAAAPSPALGAVLGEGALTGVPLAPGSVVPLPIETTPFVAVLLAPLDAGSFVVERTQGQERCALRAIPLTHAEAKLASDSVDQLVRALRSTGALGFMDPQRDCALVPAATRRFWALQRPWLEHRTRRRVEQAAEHRDEMVALGAPQCMIEDFERRLRVARAELRHIESKKVDPEAREERFAKAIFEHSERFERIWKEASKGLPLPPEREARRAMAEIVGVALTTHPVAEQLVALLEGDKAPPFEVDFLVARVADWIRDFHPAADLGALLAAGRSGAAVAAATPATSDGGESPSDTWKTVVWSMYLKLFDPASLAEARMDPLIASVVEGIGMAAAAFARTDSEPPESPEGRLVAEARMILLKMLMTYHDIPLDEEHRVVEGPPWRH
jgi:hypothetical protein